jgi:hypothetical protein
MSKAVEILGERVAAAAAMIVGLRSRVQNLEQELLTTHTKELPPSPPSPASSPSASDVSLAEELERLRAERVVVRESIRGLLREIDRVSW